MICDPAPDTDSYRRDLLLGDPDSGQAGATIRDEAEFAERVDHRVLEISQILGYVAGAAFEFQNRVADQLAGAVIGHLAAARYAVGRDARRIRDNEALIGAAA